MKITRKVMYQNLIHSEFGRLTTIFISFNLDNIYCFYFIFLLRQTRSYSIFQYLPQSASPLNIPFVHLFAIFWTLFGFFVAPKLAPAVLSEFNVVLLIINLVSLTGSLNVYLINNFPDKTFQKSAQFSCLGQKLYFYTKENIFQHNFIIM